MRARLGAAVEGHLWGMLHRGEFTAAHIRIYRYDVRHGARRRGTSRCAGPTHGCGTICCRQAVDAGLLRSDIPVPW